jgi:signal transduction histidine kinase
MAAGTAEPQELHELCVPILHAEDQTHNQQDTAEATAAILLDVGRRQGDTDDDIVYSTAPNIRAWLKKKMVIRANARMLHLLDGPLVSPDFGLDLRWLTLTFVDDRVEKAYAATRVEEARASYRNGIALVGLVAGMQATTWMDTEVDHESTCKSTLPEGLLVSASHLNTLDVVTFVLIGVSLILSTIGVSFARKCKPLFLTMLEWFNWVIPTYLVIVLGLHMLFAVHASQCDGEALAQITIDVVNRTAQYSWQGKLCLAEFGFYDIFEMWSSMYTTASIFMTVGMFQMYYLLMLVLLAMLSLSYWQLSLLVILVAGSYTYLYFAVGHAADRGFYHQTTKGQPDGAPSQSLLLMTSIQMNLLPLLVASFFTLFQQRAADRSRRSALMNFLLRARDVHSLTAEVTEEKLENAKLAERNAVLVAEVAQLALEREKKLRQEAEDKLELERKITTYVCHELRQPFVTVKGSSTILNETLSRSLEQVRSGNHRNSEREMANCLGEGRTIFDSAVYMTDFLDYVFDLTKLEQGKLQLSDKPVHLSFVLGKVVERCKQALQLSSKAVRIEMDVDSGLCVGGDGARLEQVLNALVDHAVKRTSAGFVRISAKVSRGAAGGDHLRVKVLDTGSAVHARDLPFLFSKFASVGAIGTRRSNKPGSAQVLPELSPQQQPLRADTMQPIAERIEAKSDSGMALVFSHQIVQLWGSKSGLQAESPVWSDDQRRWTSASKPKTAKRVMPHKHWGAGASLSFSVPVEVLSRQTPGPSEAAGELPPASEPCAPPASASASAPGVRVGVRTPPLQSEACSASEPALDDSPPVSPRDGRRHRASSPAEALAPPVPVGIRSTSSSES